MLATCIGAAITQQVRREGDICMIASEIALLSKREDIVPPDVKLEILIDLASFMIIEELPGPPPRFCQRICA